MTSFSFLHNYFVFLLLDLKREIAVWQKTAAMLGSYSKDENTLKNSLLKGTARLIGKLNNTPTNKTQPIDNYQVDYSYLFEKVR